METLTTCVLCSGRKNLSFGKIEMDIEIFPEGYELDKARGINVFTKRISIIAYNGRVDIVSHTFGKY